MAAEREPRTRLEQLLRQRRLTLTAFRRQYRELGGIDLSERQAYRWVSGELTSLPHLSAQGALEKLFSEPPSRLFGPPYGAPGGLVPAGPGPDATSRFGRDRIDWEGQVISMSADRARKFLSSAESSNVGPETLDQLTDDIRRLAVAYQQRPLGEILGEMVDVQSSAFTLLEGRQKPGQTRDLYLMAGVVSGFMAKASHDLGASHDALTQARAAYACADNAGHDGLRAWTRGLQSLIAYWAGRLDDAARYARLGLDVAPGLGTSSVWLHSSEARALAGLGRMGEARSALDRAAEAQDRVQPDTLDELGGMCTFGRARQLYYGADALSWSTAAEAEAIAEYAADSIDAYVSGPSIERAFGDEAGARCALAIARVYSSQLDGAVDAMTPVLELPREKRINGIVSSVARVQQTLNSPELAGRERRELFDALEAYSAERIALPK